MSDQETTDAPKNDPCQRVKDLVRAFAPAIDDIPTDTPEQRRAFCRTLMVQLRSFKAKVASGNLTRAELMMVEELEKHALLIGVIEEIADLGR